MNAKKILIPVLLLVAAGLCAGYWFLSSPRVAIDFSTTAGFQETCAEVKPRLFEPDEEKLARVVCRAIELAQRTGRFGKKMNDTRREYRDKEEALIKVIRAELKASLEHIQESREILEGVHLSQTAFVISPGNWELDYDGDSQIDEFEKHLLWVPKSGIKIPLFWSEPDRSEYYPKYFSKTQIRLDQSDVYWAIAYCHFAEGVLNLALSYDIKPTGFFKFESSLKEAERIRAAHEHFSKAIKYSGKLRTALLEETDDDLEWIPNPKQKNTVFPLTLDAQLFDTWGVLLTQIDEILQGKKLIAATQTDPIGEFFDLNTGCPAGQGISVKKLFDAPLADLNQLENIKERCESTTADVPLSELNKTLKEIFERNSQGEFDAKRYLYWIN